MSMDDKVNKPSLEEIKTSFFTYWETLPIIKEMDPATFKKIAQPIRHGIISILSTGISDTMPVTNEHVRRHVLSASEIMKVLEEKYEMQVKKSNLYFHLENLEKCHCIKVVEQIATGKRFTTYYGRTAKVFYPKPENISDTDNSMSENSPIRQTAVKELIIRMNPKIPVEEIEETLKIADGINQYDHNLFRNWVEKYQKYTEGLDINFVSFHGLLSILDRYNSNTLQGLIKLAELIGLHNVSSQKDVKYKTD